MEVPDETFQVQLYLPGVEPAYGSNMWSRISITDDGDGGVGVRGYYEKLYGQIDLGMGVYSDSIRGGLYGSSLALANTGSAILLLVGSPGVDVDNVASVGRVR